MFYLVCKLEMQPTKEQSYNFKKYFAWIFKKSYIFAQVLIGN